jgi:hypothetical protein
VDGTPVVGSVYSSVRGGTSRARPGFSASRCSTTAAGLSGDEPRRVGQKVFEASGRRPNASTLGAQLRLTDWTATGSPALSPASAPAGTAVGSQIWNRTGKDTGLRNLPLHSFAADQVWSELIALGHGTDGLGADASPRPICLFSVEDPSFFHTTPFPEFHSTCTYVKGSLTLPMVGAPRLLVA